jgi:hypothetical protein
MFCVAGAYCKVPCSFYRNCIAAMKYQTSVIRHKNGKRNTGFSMKPHIPQHSRVQEFYVLDQPSIKTGVCKRKAKLSLRLITRERQ